MANTANYNWPLPSPSGIQMNEVAKIATSFTAIDTKIKAFETSFSNHKHKFADLEDKPTTLGGYGITDGMTADEVAQAIKKAVDDLVNGSGSALDTLKELADALGNDPEFATTVGNALGVRVRVDAAQSFSLSEKAQGRSNIDAVGTVDKGKPDGVASLDSTGKVPTAQLPALTTTATVGAALAGANSKATPDDGDFFAGVLAGGSTPFKTTWGNIKTALKVYFDSIYQKALGFIPIRQGFSASTVTIGWGSNGRINLHVDNTTFGETWPMNISGDAATLGGKSRTAFDNDIGARVIRDYATHVGFAAGDVNSPYIRHGTSGTGEVVFLARSNQIPDVMATIAAQSPAALGTYALLYWGGAGGTGILVPGSLRSGSEFSWSSAGGNSNQGAPGGSWRTMGYCDTSSNVQRVTLQLRYS